jgi:hypothetical protein
MALYRPTDRLPTVVESPMKEGAKMQTSARTLPAVLMLFTLLVSCAKMPNGDPANDQILGSPSVVREMRNTRPAFAALTPDQQASMHFWLLANCETGVDNRHAQIVKAGAGMETAFIESFRMGPPKALLAELNKTRHRDFAAIKEGLDGEDRDLFDPELRGRLAALTEDAYVTEGEQITTKSYRIAALDGLALIGSSASVAWLEQIAPTLHDPELTRAAERTYTALLERNPK